MSGKRIIALLLISLWTLTSCAQHRYTEKYDLNFFSRIQTKNIGDVEVSVAVLSSEESAELFGTFVAETGIQPVWIRIRNNDPFPYRLYSVGLDPEYFSPHEAAWKNHFSILGFSSNLSSMNSDFRRHAIYPYIPPEETVSGFVYTRLNEGVKAVSVELKSENREGKSFFFIAKIPGFQGKNVTQVDHHRIYSETEITNIENLEILRKWIENLPATVFGEDNVSPGDPLNLVMIGRFKDITPAFIHQNWELAENAHFGALWRMVKSFIFGSQYRYSPMSPLYLYGRRQDVSLQKARSTIDERTHLRLWRAPADFQGMPILVGQISRDIGVRFTGKLSPPTTHIIDPDVDESRWYLEQDLTLSQRVARVGLAAGVGRALEKQPRHNLMGDIYYTDGLRLVVIFTGVPTSFSQIDYLPWEKPEDIRHLISGEQ